MRDDTEYLEVPGHPECKKGIFEISDDNCFFCGAMRDLSPLCSWDTAASADIWSYKSGYVVEIYERLLIVDNGEVIYRNPSPRGRMPDRIKPEDPPFSDHSAGDIVIFSECENEYSVESWGRTFRTNLICYKNNALFPERFANVSQAEREALKLSKNNGGRYITAMTVRSVDKHLGF